MKSRWWKVTAIAAVVLMASSFAATAVVAVLASQPADGFYLPYFVRQNVAFQFLNAAMVFAILTIALVYWEAKSRADRQDQKGSTSGDETLEAERQH